jgi:hypothetical protein
VAETEGLLAANQHQVHVQRLLVADVRVHFVLALHREKVHDAEPALLHRRQNRPPRARVGVVEGEDCLIPSRMLYLQQRLYPSSRQFSTRNG